MLSVVTFNLNQHFLSFILGHMNYKIGHTMFQNERLSVVWNHMVIGHYPMNMSFHNYIHFLKTKW